MTFSLHASTLASRSRVLAGLLLTIAALLAHWPAVHGAFLWDDDVHLTANPSIVGPLGLQNIWTSSAAVYYPLTLTSLWLQHQLWGLNPLPYHLVNLVMHAAASVLLWRVLEQLGMRAAWLGAALWALHPVQVESVAWITEQKNTQSGFFYLAAIWFFLRWLSAAGPGMAGKQQWSYALALLCATLAVLSKTSTVMLPIILGLCWWWKAGQWRWRSTLWLAPFLLISAAAGVWTIWEQQFHSGALGAEWVIRWPERLAIAGRIVWFYLAKLLWPHPLIFIYARWTLDAGRAATYFPVAAAALALLILWFKRDGPLRPVFFALAYFMVSLFPVSSFFNVYFFRYSFVADHFQYLAAMGPLALVAAGADAVRRRKSTLFPLVSAALLMVCGVLSWRQSSIYSSSLTLWRDTLAKNPSAWMAHTNLGAELDDQGRFSEAMAEYEAALRINPGDTGARNNLATHLARLGRLPDAVGEWQQALKLQPLRAETHTNLAFALAKLNRMPEAIVHWEEAVRINPELFDARNDFGVALAQLGRSDEAIAQFEHAVRIKPDSVEAHHKLAQILQRSGEYISALVHHRKVVDLQPRSISALNALAWLLATCPEASVRDGGEAVELAMRAAQFSGGTDPQTLDTLAAAYAETGEFERAIETSRRALTLVGRQNAELVEEIEARQRLYRSRKAYRDSGKPED